MGQEDNLAVRKACFHCGQEFDGRYEVCPADGSKLLSVPAKVDVKDDPWIGSTLNNQYEILSIVGKGGMGVVYKARNQRIDRIVALKMLKLEQASDEATVLRFEFEMRAAASLHHPNVVAVHDWGTAPTGQPYLVMDYVEGESLASVITRHGYLDFRRVVPIFVQVCAALAHAHRQQIIHRDVKPANIVLLQAEGQPDFVKVLDFGLAKLTILSEESLRLTKTGQVWGSPYYMSPEQCMAGELDPRADIYSVGASLYETLLGLPPFEGKSVMDTLLKQINEVPRPFKVAQPNLDIPQALESVVMKSLEKDRERRYDTALQMKEALEVTALGLNVTLPPQALGVPGGAPAAAPASGAPPLAQSQFAGVDLRSEVQKELEKEPVAPNLRVEELKAKARAVRLLRQSKSARADAEAEAGPPGGKDQTAPPTAATGLPDSSSPDLELLPKRESPAPDQNQDPPAANSNLDAHPAPVPAKLAQPGKMANKTRFSGSEPRQFPPIVAIMAVVLLAAGGFFWFTHSGQKTEEKFTGYGTVYFLEQNKNGGRVNLFMKDGRLLKLTFGKFDGLTMKQPSATALGAVWNVLCKDGVNCQRIDEALFEGNFDKDIRTAEHSLRSHYMQLGRGQFKTAYDEMSPNYKSSEPFVKFQDAAKKAKYLRVDDRTVLPIKVISKDGSTMKLDVDLKHVSKGAHEYLAMTLQQIQNRWCIDQIQPINKAQWDSD